MGRSILLTGDVGYIGSHLTPRLLSAMGVSDTLSYRDIKYDGFDFADIQDRRFDIVIHLAAHSSVTQSLKDPDECLNNNAFKLIPFLQNNSIGKLIFTSTGGAIYGEKHFAKEEDASWNGCISPYGQSKYLAEQIIRRLHPNHTILRLGNVVGGEDGNRLELAAHARFKTDNPIVVYGGDQTRDFVHVDDVCGAIIRAMQTNVVGTFNIGSGTETRVGDVAENYAKERGVPIRYAMARWGEIVNVSLDVTKARKAGLL
jgi:UDP-glucose 4-epimerase